MYNLFISHSWAYSDTYECLINLLKAAPYFSFRNYSVPQNDPIHNAPNTQLLRAAIREQMSHASCVLVLGGVYATYSKWINIEIDLAQNGFVYPKPIIAIKPWTAKELSSVVRNAANTVVGWNAHSIVSAIRTYAINS